MAERRHKRDAVARLLASASTLPVLVAGPLAVAATAGVVSVGVALTGSATDAAPAAEAGTATSDLAVLAGTAVSNLAVRERVTASAERSARISRDAARTELAVDRADTHRWTTAPLNLWSDAGRDARRVGVLDAGRKVLVTGRAAEGRVEVVVDGESRWVTAGYLAAEKPAAPPTAPAGLSSAPCPDGSVENGLTSAAIAVYRAVCHAFPQITTYGGWDAHGEHASGKALDIMTSDVSLGTSIAEFLQRNAAALDLYDIIWRQHIWTPERASEGWRSMPDRGSATANHYDHVHVSVN